MSMSMSMSMSLSMSMSMSMSIYNLAIIEGGSELEVIQAFERSVCQMSLPIPPPEVQSTCVCVCVCVRVCVCVCTTGLGCRQRDLISLIGPKHARIAVCSAIEPCAQSTEAPIAAATCLLLRIFLGLCARGVRAREPLGGAALGTSHAPSHAHSRACTLTHARITHIHTRTLLAPQAPAPTPAARFPLRVCICTAALLPALGRTPRARHRPPLRTMRVTTRA